MELQQTLEGLRPLHFTADDVYHVFRMAVAETEKPFYEQKLNFLTPYAMATQQFFTSLPAEHELLKSLSAREAFAKQVRELWTAHLAMQPDE